MKGPTTLLTRCVTLLLFLITSTVVSRSADVTVQNGNASGPGSLLQVVSDADPGFVIDFHPDLSGETIPISVPIGITKNLTIDGRSLTNPVTITGQGVRRLMTVTGGAEITVRSVIFTDGAADSATDGTNPADGQSGGAFTVIGSGSTLTLINCSVQNNRAGEGGSQTGGGSSNSGGNGGNGGAISVSSGALLNIIGCTFVSNYAGDGGDGIAPASDAGNGGRGGAIYAVTADITIINSTFSGNIAGDGATDGEAPGFGGEGGAIFLLSSSLIACNSTFTANLGGDAGGPTTGGSGGAIFASSSDTELGNTIVAGNSKGSGNGAEISDDILETGGTILSLGGNCIGSNRTIDTEFPVVNMNGDLVGTAGAPFDPQLFALQDNGGKTLTHEPLPNSLLIGAGNPMILPMDAFDLDGDMDVMESLPIDQTGRSRIGGGALDIGAIEYVEPVVNDNAVLKSRLKRKIKKLLKRVKKLKKAGKRTAAKRVKKKVRKFKKRLRAL
ncbi:MAG: hypothetical protein CMO55_10860 [Verrucomicrobiales bacterium]|nr:hypothetical protein [Verrucomicrobiales bacterium]